MLSKKKIVTKGCMFSLRMGGCGFKHWLNPSSDLITVNQLLISETLHINNERRTGMPCFRIMWQGHPDIANKVEKDIK